MFLTAPYLSSFNYLQPILAQRPIWRDVPVERLPGNSDHSFALRQEHYSPRDSPKTRLVGTHMPPTKANPAWFPLSKRNADSCASYRPNDGASPGRKNLPLSLLRVAPKNQRAIVVGNELGRLVSGLLKTNPVSPRLPFPGTWAQSRPGRIGRRRQR